MKLLNLYKLTRKDGWDKTNIRIGKWRILAVALLGGSYFLFTARNTEWLLFWMAWLLYAGMWLPLQGLHTSENPNKWTYFFVFGDILAFILANNIEHNILNNYSVLMVLPLFQYLLRYGRRVALHYVGFSVAAIIYICLSNYQIHPINHFAVAAVMFLIAYNEGLLVQENSELRKQLSNMAIVDELTGLYNFRFFNEAIERELSRCRRYGYQLTLLLIDIDNFKKVNDTFGHEKGNQVLKRFAGIIINSLRETDLAARYGGEELSVILPQTSSEDGILIAERLRESLSQYLFDFGTVTVSIGVSTYPAPSDCKDALIKNADGAMYEAKNSGKNSVRVYAQ